MNVLFLTSRPKKKYMNVHIQIRSGHDLAGYAVPWVYYIWIILLW